MCAVILVGLGLLKKMTQQKPSAAPKSEESKISKKADETEELEKMLAEVKPEDNRTSSTHYATPEFSKAIMNQALADINMKNNKLRNIDATGLIGKSFPEIDELDVTKNYIDFRKQAKEKALSTTKKLYRTFTTGALGNMKNREGVIIGRIEVPKNRDGADYSDFDTSSYRMIEYKKGTKEIAAITRVYNHSDFKLDWDARFAPYMERMEFGDTPDEDTFLRATFSSERIGERYILTPKVTLFAQGYRTDDKTCGKRYADKWLSSELYDKYESYRENYCAPDFIFDGHIGGMPAPKGLSGETFDSAIDYPVIQMRSEGNTLFLHSPVVNIEGKKA